MKKQLILILAIFTVGSGYVVAKEKSSTDVALKEIKANVDKDSRKTAKALLKDGWQVMPGRVTLEKQVERSRVAELSLDDKENNIYLIGTHRALGGNYSAAKSIATVRAKGELASQLQTNIKRTIMDKNANKQISSEDIELIDESISAMMESVDVDMAGIKNLLEIYRDADGGKCEVMITLSVKADLLVEQALDRISRDFAGRSDLIIK